MHSMKLFIVAAALAVISSASQQAATEQKLPKESVKKWSAEYSTENPKETTWGNYEYDPHHVETKLRTLNEGEGWNSHSETLEYNYSSQASEEHQKKAEGFKAEVESKYGKKQA